MQTIDTYNFQGKRALIRVDFNVPLNDKFEITDDTRMRAAVPTIRKVLEGGGAVILMSHLGRPKGVDEKYSLKHIRKHLEELLGQPVKFADDCVGEDAKRQAAALQPGEVLLLENLRFHAEEDSSSQTWHRSETHGLTTHSALPTVRMPLRRLSPLTSPTTKCSVISWSASSTPWTT